MGYFSRLAIDYDGYPDRSYPSPLEQATWRLEDLQTRLIELCEKEEAYYDRKRLSDEVLKYGDVWEFDGINSVMDAIEFAEARVERERRLELLTLLEANWSGTFPTCFAEKAA